MRCNSRKQNTREWGGKKENLRAELWNSLTINFKRCQVLNIWRQWLTAKMLGAFKLLTEYKLDGMPITDVKI